MHTSADHIKELEKRFYVALLMSNVATPKT
jgi:hypothetical protein